MPTISLTDFVDFVLASGTPRITKVRQVKTRGDYDPATDFWKPLREAIQTLHSQGREKSVLDDLVRGLTDEKKKTAYPPLVKAYKRFIGSKSIEWFEPPSDSWTHQELAVRVNPELGLRISDTPHVIKLYFKKEPLSKRRVEVILYLMSSTLLDPWDAEVTIGVLDVPRARLVTPTVTVPNLELLLQSEAAAFGEIWQGL
jgi:hypothetical protein